MIEEAGAAIADWWGAIVATPFVAIASRRLLNTYTKADVNKLMDAKVDPLLELIKDTRVVMKENTDILIQVRIKMAEHRIGD